MTAHELDQPRMIYTGDIPPHLVMRPLDSDLDDEAGDEAYLEPEQEARRSVVPTVLATGAALAAGIAIGVFAPALWRGDASPPEPARPAAQPAAPPSDLIAPAGPASSAPAQPLPASTIAEAPPRPTAKAASPPIRLAVARVSRAAPGPWRPIRHSDKSCAPYACPDPEITAAEADLQAAYQRARSAGAPADQLRAGQIDWLLTRQAAANRSPAELAGVYRQRIAQLNALAEGEPPH